LAENEKKILGELNSVQGQPADIGGYYLPDMKKVTAIMRPSATFNAIVDALKA
jgi:isocitrate dehydrogenase